MKRTLTLFALAAILAVATSVGHADSKMDSDAKKSMKGGDVSATLEAKERQMQEIVKNKDIDGFMSMVDPDGWSADANGFMPVSAMRDMMKDIDVRSYTVDEFKAMMVTRDVYITHYVWKGDASFKGQTYPSGPWYCSTVWAKRGKDWKAMYHQESMAMPSTPSAESH
jgi:hypothetical protein